MNSTSTLPRARFAWIFRKDLRLLWPFAVASAAGQALLALVVFHVDPFGISEERSGFAALVTLALAVSMVLLIVLTVQQDPIPGVSQDWLVRPIRRRDLLLGKLLAVAVLIHGPCVVVKLLQGLATGFDPGPLLGAVLASNIQIALLFSLPVMAVAAMTRSVGEAIIVALILLVWLVLARLLVLGFLYPFTHTFHFFDSGDEVVGTWLWRSLSHLILLAVFVSVLLVQYLRRATSASRAILAVGLLLYMTIGSLPGQPAFAIQRWLGSDSDAGRTVSVELDSTVRGAGEVVSRKLDNLIFSPAQTHEKKTEPVRGHGPVSIILPLKVSGLPRRSVLHVDRSAVRLERPDGRVVYRGMGHPFDLRESDPSAVPGEAGKLAQSIEIPASVFARVAGESLRLEVDYTLTLIRPRSLGPMPAVDGRLNAPDVGSCASRVERDRTAVQVACRRVWAVPPCMSAALVQPDGGQRNPEKFDCDLSYEPTLVRISTEPIDRFQVALPFKAPDSGGPLPVTGPDAAQVSLTVYEPIGHFSRHLTIPGIRLQDWLARVP